MLKRLAVSEIPAVRRDPVEPKARTIAEPIVEAVRTEGEKALRRYAEQFGELQPGAKLVYTRDNELRKAYETLDPEQRQCLERTAARIRAFAAAQRECLTEVTVCIPGGEAGHTVSPVEAAGCYAPGGRYPLPSTVLMTAVTARVAGCSRVVVASPRPSQVTLAAAYIAEADVLLPIGGAHAIAALAYGAAGVLDPCDAVVGPGNMFVTAAKSLVAGRVAIDMLAGPSECIVLADDTADASVVAKDLLAQAEHDPAALPSLICRSEAFAAAVDAELDKQLKVLSTAEIASQSLKNGYTVVVDSVDEMAAISDRLAVEHVELHVANAMALKAKLQHYGGLFVGGGAAEVLGDYGAGPNHTLPTGGTARSTGGLCVLTFLRVRTWMRVDDMLAAKQMTQDCVMLGELEGLMGHAAAARARLPSPEEERASELVSVPTGISTKGASLTDRLLFAVPKKGRMSEKCLKFLEAAGLEYHRPERVDVAQCTNLPITLVFLPAADIAQYVGEGNVDMGITGEDIVAESGLSVNIGMKLGFGKCKLALQVPEQHKDAPVAAYVGSRIVTSFPNITKRFFAPLDAAATALRKGDSKNPPVETSVKVLGGSVEAACGLGLADAIVDLVETGTTMRAAGLTMLQTIMETEAVLITNPQGKHKELTETLIARIQGYIDSTKYQLIAYNVPRSKMEQAIKITPGKKSPSITPLERGDWVAVQALVKKKEVASIMDQIVAVGGEDILVYSLSNCRV
jgi:ATP phosphoribosyltransferase